MTALTLALVAGMAVGSDGAERISTETEQHFMGNGYWEGTLVGTVHNVVRFEPGKISLLGRKSSCRWIDEGQGRCQYILEGCNVDRGIYKREAEQLTICMSRLGDRPTKFESEGRYILMVLKPAKPSKK